MTDRIAKCCYRDRCVEGYRHEKSIIWFQCHTSSGRPTSFLMNDHCPYDGRMSAKKCEYWKAK